MTETSSAQPSLSTMRLAELQSLASSMGLKGISRMRKSELVAAIRQARGSSASTPDSHEASDSSPDAGADATDTSSASSSSATSSESSQAAGSARSRRRRATAASGAPEEHQSSPALDLGIDLPDRSGSDSDRDGERPARNRWRERTERSERSERTEAADGGDSYSRSERGERPSRDQPRRGRRRAQASAGAPENQDRGSHEPRTDSPEDHADAKAALMRDLADATGTSVVESQERSRRGRDSGDETDGYDEERGGRRRRGRKRGRDRFDRDDRDGNRDQRDSRDNSGGRQNRNQSREDEVLLPVAGILDVTDNQHAYLRTSGYLPGPKDVYVSNQLIKDNGLRAGDAVTGWVREGGESSAPQGGRGNRRQNRAGRVKYNPMVSVETVNGMDAERSKRRPEFAKLTPLYPQEQLRLETTPKAVTPRIIDLVSPIGKGQRGLIVSPPKAGKTIILQQIANAISVNNPEAHLMVVLVDERPEEVTDMQRTVKGEVIASTFDRPASDHTIVAELAIERAKRLVELGQDVVVLLDSITRLGRAYNLAAPASGRILSGGVDASALYPPKRFFGAARNVENGGSLTILATALVETGSKMDEVIFEEFKGTGNMELRLSRQLADKRIFPAVDVAASGTRREELLIDPAQLKIMWRLRRLFAGLEQQQALELVLSKLKDTQSNAEFLMVLSKTTPAGTSLADGEDE